MAAIMSKARRMAILGRIGVYNDLEMHFKTGLAGKGYIPAKFIPKDAERFACVSLDYTVKESGAKRHSHYVLFRWVVTEDAEEAREHWVALTLKQCPDEPGRPGQTWRMKETTLSGWYYGVYNERLNKEPIKGIEVTKLHMRKRVPTETEDLIQAMKFCEKLGGV